MTEKQISFKIDSETKEEFSSLLDEEAHNQAEVLRDLVRVFNEARPKSELKHSKFMEQLKYLDS